MEKEVKIIMWHILVRLMNMRKWGGAHSELKKVVKSLPSHIKETIKGKKLINKALNNLVNMGFIGVYKKTGENHTSLNSRKSKEIKEFINEIKREIEN